MRAAGNGREGLDLAQAFQPQVIVVDIEMPEMDGYETITQLRSIDSTRHIPVMVASSYAMPGERQRALDLGAQDYLEKPFDPEDFMARVRNIAPAKS